MENKNALILKFVKECTSHLHCINCPFDGEEPGQCLINFVEDYRKKHPHSMEV